MNSRYSQKSVKCLCLIESITLLYVNNYLKAFANLTGLYEKNSMLNLITQSCGEQYYQDSTVKCGTREITF